MHVVHLIQGLQVGGLEYMVCNLLKGLNRNLFTPAVCCFDTLGPLSGGLEEDGITVDLIPRKPGRDFTYPWRLARFLRRQKVKVLHLHNPTALFYGTLAGRLARVPVIVYTEHGRDHSSSLKIRLADKLMSELVDRVAVVAEHGRQRLIVQEWMRPGKIVKIFNGISGEQFNGNMDRAGARQALGLPPDAPLLCIAARLDPIKNHRLLFRALQRVVQDLPGVQLLVVGDGPLREELEAQVKDLELQGQVSFLGDRNDVNRLLAACDLFVLPSVSEGLSMTLLEACASARPIVATDVGGNAEVVQHGANGLLVPSGDQQALARGILDILKDKDRARAMGLAGRALFEREFSVDTMVREYEALYVELLEKKGITDRRCLSTNAHEYSRMNN